VVSMRSRKWPGLAIVFILTFIYFSGAASSEEYSLSPDGELLIIPRGESLLLPVFEPKRVAVTDPTIADVVVVNTEQVLINGINVGTTSLQIWEEKGVAYYRVRVVPNPDALVAELRKQLGLPEVKINILNDKVILDGSIDDESQRERAVKAASAYGEVIDLMQVKAAPGEAELAEAAAAVIQRPGIEVRAVNGCIVLEGEVSSLAERQRAEMLASTFGSPVLNFLHVSVQEASLDRLAEEIVQHIGLPMVEVKVIAGDTFLLEGTVPDLASKERAAAIAKAFGRTVIDLIEVELPKSPLDESSSIVETDEGKDSPQPVETVQTVSDSAAESIVEEGLVPAPDVNHWAHEIQQEAGDPRLSTRVVRDAVLLEGTVESAHSRERIRAIAGLYPVKVIDLLQVEGQPEEDFTEEKERLDYYLQDPNIQATLIGRTVLLEGEAASELARRRAVTAARALGLEVVDLLVLKEDAEGLEAADEIEPSEEPVPEEPPLELSTVVPDMDAALAEESLAVYELNGFIVIEGQLPNEFRKLRAERLAATFGVPLVTLIEVESPIVEEKPLDAAGSLGPLPSEVPGTAGYPEQSTALEPARELPGAAGPKLAEDDLLERESPIEGAESGGAAEGSLDEPEIDLASKVQQAIGLPNISVKVFEGAVVLDGTVANEEEAHGAEAIAGIFADQVVSRLQVLPKPQAPEPSLSEIIGAVLGLPTIKVSLVGEKLLLEGTVTDQNQLERAVQVAGAFGKEVVNLIRVAAPYQVLIKVRVIEASRSDLEKLGFTWGSLDRGVLIPDKALFGELMIGESIVRLLPIGTELEALVDAGKARLLAAPSLLTLSGREASFLSGGEIPVVVPKDGELQILWKEYGVKLEILPIVLDDGSIEVKLKPEVSTLDWTNGIRVDNLTLPAMKTRRTETVIYIEDGTTFVIGGLLENNESEQVHKVPLLGDLPIIGKLFRSDQFQIGQTELVFFVTPHILKGNEPADNLELWRDEDVERGGQHLWVDD
jgi:pilus assembly protein CpaC